MFALILTPSFSAKGPLADNEALLKATLDGNTLMVQALLDLFSVSCSAQGAGAPRTSESPTILGTAAQSKENDLKGERK